MTTREKVNHAEIAKMLNVSTRTVERYIAAGFFGEPSSTTKKGRPRFTREQIEKILWQDPSVQSRGWIRETAFGTPIGMTRRSDGRSASRFIQETLAKHRIVSRRS
jgi:hypothetical protein